MGRKIRIIGITGSFGSGKTTVARMFKKIIKNAKILDADRIAKNVMKDKKNSAKIKKEFGTANRKKLAEIVFSHRSKLKKINKIIHPIVITKIRKEIQKSNKKFIILDVPLLFEAGLYRICDAVIVVKCRKGIQIKRLERKGFRKDEILKRIRTQMPVTKKARFAAYIINNSSGLCDTEKQAKRVALKVLR